jgi:lipopolysaccharide/colanic/teichoic acid biosynthesis glycosyltransferase
MLRFFDVLFSGLATIILLPLLLPVMLILRFTGDREVFYRQPRIGLGGQEFQVLKFTTMIKGSEAMAGGHLTQRDDPRILPVGRFLRKTKINELPQLLNILAGDMSIVGPRPQTREHYDLYSAEVKREIDLVRPGLTGLGSVVFRDEEAILHAVPGDSAEFHDKTIVPFKGALETWYAEHRGLRSYFLLIAITVWVVIRPQSDIYRHFFTDLPIPDEKLAPYLNWNS